MKVIHPFPARMAPEIALSRIGDLPADAVLLDPMCGSGTVLRAGVEHGANVLGTDVDPMAVLMARVWCNPPTRSQFLHDVHELLSQAAATEVENLDDLVWVDEETSDFIKFWFGAEQRASLVRLASVLHGSQLPSADALRVALSRIIVTKERGASLARDTSHSRPHKVAMESDYDVEAEFLKSARLMSARLVPEAVRGSSSIELADGRELTHIENESVDCVITSPPYLNAIDYLRGHRMSLVWLGYSAAQIRDIRGASIGAEKILAAQDHDPADYISGSGGEVAPARIVGWATRYVKDAREVATQVQRVLRPGADVVMVVGNSTLRGFRIDNAQICADALEDAGLTVNEMTEREIPTRSRYLPTSAGSALASRMRVEVVISASKPDVSPRRAAASRSKRGVR